MKKLKKTKGFTLIEMAIVLFIISLLILIIIPNINHQRKNAVNVNTNAMKTELRTQSQLYLSEHPSTSAASLTTTMLVNDHYLTNEQANKLDAEKITIQDVLDEK